MKNKKTNNIKKMLYFLLLILNFYSIYAHSWIDSLYCVSNNKIGYIRNYNNRNNIIDYDNFMTYKILNHDKNNNICSLHQQLPIYNSNYPKLQCYPGSIVIIKYFTNGHTMNSDFEVNDPRQNTFWSIHMNNKIYPNNLHILDDVNKNITFNDDSGLINYISKHNLFNFNLNCNHTLSEECTASFTLPTDLHIGNTYNLYWIWQLDRDFKGSGEIYTSCADVEIIDKPHC